VLKQGLLKGDLEMVDYAESYGNIAAHADNAGLLTEEACGAEAAEDTGPAGPVVLVQGDYLFQIGTGASTEDLLANARSLLGLTDDDFPSIARIADSVDATDAATQCLVETMSAPGFRKEAAAVLLVRDVKRTSEMEKLAQRLEEKAREIADHPDSLIRKVLEAKSETRGCKHCSASLPVKFILPDSHAGAGKTVIAHFGPTCPVCGADYVTVDGDRARLSKLQDDAADLTKRLQEAEKRAREKSGGVWVVGVRKEDATPEKQRAIDKVEEVLHGLP
jgi:hypothetical protein